MLITPHIRRLLTLALEEDLGFGDITSELTISDDSVSNAQIELREEGVVCGGFLVPELFSLMGWSVHWEQCLGEGELRAKGDVIGLLRGPTRYLLAIERTALNFLQRLSGIATHTRRFVERASPIVVLDTRKTTPGWRVLEKYAVRVGGARNHRMNLSDLILVKDNHIDANGGSISKTLERIHAEKPAYVKVELEVRTLAELQEAILKEVDVVMLDNMNDQDLSTALGIIADSEKPIQVEVSGGISVERLDRLKQLQVPMISVGGLTHSAPSLDISLTVL